ncbi:MAG TPA: SHOCT domain-containing protein [Nitrospiria bacterium]|nr:SHOCT domain-containing protein [Nitrospiria bacterium]
MYHYEMGMGFFWWLFPAIFFLFFVGLTALFFKRSGISGCGHHPHHGEGVNAKEILERRYARGEIGRDEYLKIKQDLESK